MVISGRRTPVFIPFDPEDAGKFITLYARWVTAIGKTGHWDNGVTTIVP